MQQGNKNPYSVEELIDIAKTEDISAPESKSDPRLLKDIEMFISNLEVKSGKKTVHNVILYALYREWQKTTEYKELTREEFLKGISYFFPKVLNSQNNVCFKLSPKLNDKKRINLTNKHFLECRALYGKAKKEITNEETTKSVSGIREEAESNQS